MALLLSWAWVSAPPEPRCPGSSGKRTSHHDHPGATLVMAASRHRARAGRGGQRSLAGPAAGLELDLHPRRDASADGAAGDAISRGGARLAGVRRGAAAEPALDAGR